MEKDETPKKAEMAPGTLDALILKTLERDREPMHGCGIGQRLRRTTNDALRVEEGALYPALQRLAVNGWVKTEWGQSEKNHRAGSTDWRRRGGSDSGERSLTSSGRRRRFCSWRNRWGGRS